MTLDEIRSLVRALEATTGPTKEEAWQALKPLGVGVCAHLLAAYPAFKKWQGRVSLVFHSVRYARVSEDAFRLGVLALKDRASLVRYRACSLLAYSQRDDAVPHLKALLTHEDVKTAQDAEAAIDAIQSHNHHFFHDRTHSGRMSWVVNEGDRQG